MHVIHLHTARAFPQRMLTRGPVYTKYAYSYPWYILCTVPAYAWSSVYGIRLPMVN